MEENFADLLTGAFSDTSLPSFPEGELDFEPLHFDEYLPNRRLPALKEEDEEIGQTISMSVRDVLVTHELSLTEDNTNNTDEETDSTEDQEGAGGTERFGTGVRKTPVKHPRVKTVVAHKMEEEITDSGEDIEEDIGTETLCSPGSWSLVVRSEEAFWDREQEVIGIGVSEGQALALEGTEHPQVRNEQQGEIQNNDVTYFGRVSAHGRVKMTEHVCDVLENVERQREEEECSSDSDQEGSNFSTEPHQDTEQAVSILKQNAALVNDNNEDEKDRISVVVSEVPDVAMPDRDDLVVCSCVQQHIEDKTKSFSEEDHQEAGDRQDREQSDKATGDVGRSSGEVHVARELPNSLYDIPAERSIKTFEWSVEDESDSYKSSEDEDQNKTCEELPPGSTHQGLWKDKRAGDPLLHREGGKNSLPHSVDDQRIRETSSFCPTVTILPAEQCNAEVQQTGRLETDIHTRTNANEHGTIDDSFMFDDQYKNWGITEEEDDEDEESERNWEKEQERIDAFYKFYSDEEQENITETKTRRVQFCVDSLSQIFQYDADSSSEVEEDLNPGKDCNLEDETQMIHNKKRSLSMLKFMLNMSLATLMGLAVFWWAKDQLHWLD
ncbi:uncharacterized protein si:dkey-183p4.10 isoform X2 [Hypomesus transpacificus]|uniref:uncharacterized protein si:dkey-183p4.10 isoform X2 n=1 Tax=Hypomesus transpacificus TaxID=137520 RepID=UPI001F0733E0|nr:uncharacterized protein si:dkey-183p4.10 isoform X2 [Hypomesus transpacificus]